MIVVASVVLSQYTNITVTDKKITDRRHNMTIAELCNAYYDVHLIVNSSWTANIAFVDSVRGVFELYLPQQLQEKYI